VKQINERRLRRSAPVNLPSAPDDARRQPLHPLDEFDVAMKVIGEFAQSIQNADTKSGMLGALLGLMLAGVTTDFTVVRATVAAPAPVQHLAVVLLGAFAVSLVAAGVCLGLTQMPRLSTPPTVRRLSFLAVARGVAEPGRPSAVELRDEAWCQARALAVIARLKFRYLQVGLIASGVCALAFVTWLGLATTVA
jgi:hypothetical protein